MPQAPKAVFFNNEKVGEIEDCGDDRINAVKAYEMLVARGLVKQLSLAQRTFRQAAAFNGVAAQIWPQLRTDNPALANVAAPFVVNITFAIELFLKTIAALEERKVRGHQLDALFRSLPVSVQGTLEHRFPTALRHYGFQEEKSLSEALADAGNAFVEWRYTHERDAVEQGKLFRINVSVAAAYVLHGYCVDTGKV